MHFIGLDLGQRHDFSAIAVVQSLESRQAFQGPVFDSAAVRKLERIPLGTPYPLVVARVRAMAHHPRLAGHCAVVVDATGVGAPVVDLLRTARLGCEITAVTITSGDRAHAGAAMGAGLSGVMRWNVPKRDLMVGVDVLLERGKLRIGRGVKNAGTLVKELRDVRMTVKGNGRIRMGADGCGEHDDLVIALALACWRAQMKRNGWGAVRIPGI